MPDRGLQCVLLIAAMSLLAVGRAAGEPATLEQVDMIGDPAWRHGGWITHIEPIDATRIATSARDGTVRIWHAETGEQLHRLVHDGGDVWHTLVMPGGDYLLSCGEDEKITRWDLSTGKPVATYDHGSTVFRMAVSADGKHLFAGDRNKRAIQWDVKSGETVREFDGHTENVYCVALSPDGKTLATAGEDQRIILHDAATGEMIAKFDKLGGDVFTIRFMPDGQSLISVSADRAVRRLSIDGTEQWKRGLQGIARTVDVSPDGKLVACHSREGNLLLLDAGTGQTVREIVTTAEGYPVRFSRDGRRVYAGQNGVLHGWSIADGERLHPIEPDDQPIVLGAIRQVAVTPDGTRLFVGDSADDLHGWNLATGRRIISERLDQEARTVAISPDGKRLLVGTRESGEVRRTDDGAVVHTLPSPGRSVEQWFWADGGAAIIAGDDTRAYRYDEEADGGVTMHEINWPSRNGSHDWLAADPAGAAAATEWNNRTARVFDLSRGTAIGEIEVGSAIPALRFAGGVTLVVDGDYRLRQYGRPAVVTEDDPTQRQLMQWVRDLGADRYAVRQRATEQLIAAGPDAEAALEQADLDDPEVAMRVKRIVTGAKLRHVTDRQTGQPVEIGRYVGELAISPDGKRWAVTQARDGIGSVTVGRVTRNGPTVIARTDSPHGPHGVTFGADGRTLYVGNATGTISIYRLPE